MDSLNCLFLSEKMDYKNSKDFRQLKKRNPQLLAELDFYAKTFLSFCKLFFENILKIEKNTIQELFPSFEMKYFHNFLDTVNLFDDSYILTFPLKVYKFVILLSQLFIHFIIKIFVKMKSQKKNDAEKLLQSFKEKIYDLSKFFPTMFYIKFNQFYYLFFFF